MSADLLARARSRPRLQPTSAVIDEPLGDARRARSGTLAQGGGGGSVGGRRTSGGGGGQGSEVVRTLQRHGLSPAAALATEAIGENLRQRTLGRAVEFAAMLDADTGAAVGAVLGGAQASVDIGPHVSVMQADGRYVSIHTHPRSSSFSPQDVDTLLAHRPLRIMVVLGADGTWYVLSQRFPGVPNRPAVLDAFRDAVLALRPKYLGLISSGAMSQQAAWREHTHEAWTIVAALADLRYDRIEP